MSWLETIDPWFSQPFTPSTLLQKPLKDTCSLAWIWVNSVWLKLNILHLFFKTESSFDSTCVGEPFHCFPRRLCKDSILILYYILSFSSSLSVCQITSLRRTWVLVFFSICTTTWRRVLQKQSRVCHLWAMQHVLLTEIIHLFLPKRSIRVFWADGRLVNIFECFRVQTMHSLFLSSSLLYLPLQPAVFPTGVRGVHVLPLVATLVSLFALVKSWARQLSKDAPALILARCGHAVDFLHAVSDKWCVCLLVFFLRSVHKQGIFHQMVF